jgi:hypothetical protein
MFCAASLGKHAQPYTLLLNLYLERERDARHART